MDETVWNEAVKASGSEAGVVMLISEGGFDLIRVDRQSY